MKPLDWRVDYSPIGFCSTSRQDGVDKMFLCMIAANNQAPPAIDPQQVLAEAMNVMQNLNETDKAELEKAAEEMFPAMFTPEQTPDEHPAPQGLSNPEAREK